MPIYSSKKEKRNSSKECLNVNRECFVIFHCSILYTNFASRQISFLQFGSEVTQESITLQVAMAFAVSAILPTC